MSSSNSQSPNAPRPEQLITQSLQIIPGLALGACRRYRYSPSQDEIDELTQQIVFLLIGDNYALLRSFEHRSSLKTWLFPVVTHHVKHYLRERKRWSGLEDAPLSTFVSQLTPEEEIILDERLKRLNGVLSNLNEEERELFKLRCKGLEAGKVAKLMRTTPGAIYQRVRRLKKKIQRLLEE